VPHDHLELRVRVAVLPRPDRAPREQVDVPDARERRRDARRDRAALFDHDVRVAFLRLAVHLSHDLSPRRGRELRQPRIVLGEHAREHPCDAMRFNWLVGGGRASANRMFY
jgi:hypothetical protein